MKHGFTTRGLLLCVLLAGGTAALAQHDGPPDHGGDPGAGFGHGPGPSEFHPHGMASILPPGRWWNDPRMIQDLALTADQRTKMDGILTTHRLELIDAVAATEKAEVLLDPLVASDKPDEPAILAQIGKVAEARANLEKAHARMLLALRAQLTHDQWAKLQTRRPPMHDPHNGPGHDGQGDRGGTFGGPPNGGDGSHGHGDHAGPSDHPSPGAE
ncbi:Spy/CpxP family protein refolding chaperone [Acidipila sp. EB88]|uniref:Spy/CpxP family protein refolding chaperone n=1 Tax=Acidipila sp. EB88 TaxID=2305226 RepID=UPI000FA542EE|nr:Spy/CpxP family protein refolding chaperone [Acidipila sp. EB88]RRA47872.1 periplasmic heavy metal sensor [Acidipila sp. EB88]